MLNYDATKTLTLAALYFLICIIWGTSWLFMKVLVAEVPPFTATGLRFLLAFPLFLIFSKLLKQPLWPPKGREIVVFNMYIFYFAIPYLLINYAGRFVSSGFAAILFSTVSIFMVVLSWAILKIPASANQTLGVLAGFASLVFFAVNESDSLFEHSSMLPPAAILLAALLHAVSYVLVKKHGEGIATITLNALPIGAAGFSLTLLGLSIENPEIASISPKACLALIALAVFTTGLGFLVYFFLLMRVSPVKLSFIFIFYPIIALLLSILFEGDKIKGGSVLALIAMAASFALTKKKGSILRKNFLR